MPRRLSIRAPPLATSRNIQPSTVGSRATSGLGGAAGAGAGAATAGCGIEPVTSFSFAEVDAAATVGVGRLGGAELVDGLAELGEFRGRLGLRLLDLVEAVAGLVDLACRRLGIMFEAGLQRDDLGIEPRHRGFERAYPLRRPALHLRPSAFQCPRSPARHPAHPPPSPAPPRQPSPRTGACRLDSARPSHRRQRGRRAT